MNGSPDKLTIICQDVEYWKNAYFDLIFKRGSYVNHLHTLNNRLRDRQAFVEREFEEELFKAKKKALGLMASKWWDYE